jgi:hypothetical protein
VISIRKAYCARPGVGFVEQQVYKAGSHRSYNSYSDRMVVIDSFNIQKNDGTDLAELCACRNCCTSDRYADDELAKIAGCNKKTSQSIEIQVIYECEDTCLE